MKIVLANDGSARVVAADDFSSFSVQFPVDMKTATANSCLADLGRFDGTYAWISIDALRAVLDLDKVGDESLERMIDYATNMGWVDGKTFRSHITRV
jgi:hypothetical protein